MPRPSSKTYTVPDGIRPLPIGPARDALEQHLRDAQDEEGDKPTADGTLLRGSMANNCTRNVAFQMLTVEPTNEIGVDSLVAFYVGNRYHEEIQEALRKRYGAEVEVTVSYRSAGVDMSGSADAVYTHEGVKIIVEIKSMKAFAFDLCVNGNRFDNYGPGPKKEHLMQAGIYAMAPGIDADALHMVYVNKDTGEMAEWVLSVHEPIFHLGPDVTTVTLMARDELARLSQVRDEVVSGIMPARVVPGYGLVNHMPPDVDSKHKPWNCRYCNYRDACAELPYQAFPLEAKPEWKVKTPQVLNSSTS